MKLFNARHENIGYIPSTTLETEIVGGYLAIVDVAEAKEVICDEAQSFELLSETASLAAAIVHNKQIVKYYTERMTIFDYSELLQLPDFFAKNETHPITKQLLDYHRKYGIPDLSGFLTSFHDSLFCYSEYPCEWAKSYEEKRRKGKKRSLDKSNDFDSILALQEKNAYPLVLSICFFFNFYNVFIGVAGAEKIYLNDLKKAVKFDAVYFPEQNQLLLQGKQPGFWNAAFILAITDKINGTIYAVCKNCKKWFIPPRPNVEYCSIKCRNTYNVKQSVMRRKEREKDNAAI